jgi:site-specific recombinase XerD
MPVKTNNNNNLQGVISEKMNDAFKRHMTRRGFSDRTKESYQQAVKVFTDWLDGKIYAVVTQAEIAAYQEYLATQYQTASGKTLSPVTASRVLSILRIFYDFLQSERIVSRNPARQVALPKTPKRVRKNLLATSEIRKMLAVSDADKIKLGATPEPSALRDRGLVYFLAATGIRATACANMRISDIDLERREAIVKRGKGQKSRLVFFTTGCAKMLNEYLQKARPYLICDETDRLFLSDSGQPLDRSGVNHIVKRVADQAGITKNIHPHLFRHWLCTTLLEQGVNVRIVSEIAGHSRLSTTSKYTHVSIELMRQTINSFHPKCNG